MPEFGKANAVAGAAMALFVLFGPLPGGTGSVLAAPPEPVELPGLREAPEIPVGSIILRRALPGHPSPRPEQEFPGRGAPVEDGLPEPGGGSCDKDVDLTGAIGGVVAVAAQDNGICTSADIDTYVSTAGRTYVVQAGGEEAAWIHTDVTDPANPNIVGSFRWRGGRGKNTYTPDVKAFHQGAKDYIVMGLERMAAVAFCGVVIYDVTDPTNPVQQSQFIGDDWCDVHNVFVEDDVNGDGAFVYATADNTQDLRVLDISNPANPIELGTYRRTIRGFGSTVYDDIYVHDVTVHGGMVYASYWLAGLDIFPAPLINSGNAVISELHEEVTTIDPGEIATGTPFLVHHAVPSNDGSLAFIEDEITFSTGAAPVQMWALGDQSRVDGLVLGTDVPVAPAHNLEINYDLDPDRLYVGWYKLGMQAWDFDNSGFVRNIAPSHTADVFHQAQTEADDDAYSGAWAVRLAEIGTLLYIFQSDRSFGLIVDCEGCAPPTTGTVTGTVTDSSTVSPIEGASVATDTGQNTTTNADGDYTLNDVPTGTRTVTASASGYVTQEQDAEVTEGATSVVDFPLDPEPAGGGTGTIKGTVTDANTGAKLSGVLVTTDTGESATTNKGGKYSIRNVPEGNRTVTASRAGYVTQDQPATVTADQTTTVDFALVPQ